MGDLVDRMDIDNVTDDANVVFAMNLTTDNVQAHLSATDLCGEESADDTDEQQNTLIDAPKKFRLEQLEVFKSLILEKAADIDKQQESKRQGRAVNIDNGITIGQLMEEQGKATLNNPREYQLELYERAKKENTIAVLETGSGKTLIAVLLIRYILDQELEDRAKGVLPRTTFFMVPSNTLVYQQTAVLRCNLNQRIVSRCGDMNANDRERRAWENCLVENMVVVCTPEILHQCLRHSFVRIEQINLLVFDEAHHAKKNHPYAKIIGDFYKPQHGPVQQPRPHVFGMTASPVDAKDDPVIASRELEDLLGCKIATFPLADEYRNNAKEVTLWYQVLQESFKTPLYLKLEQQLGYMPSFTRLFITAEYLSSELGRWAADKYWEFALRDEGKNKAHSRMEKVQGKYGSRDVASQDAEIAQLRQAYDIVKNHDFGRLEVDYQDLSSKVYVLHQFLNEHYEDDLKNRCIVFVEQKATARMLTVIFEEIGATYLRPGLLTGHAAKSGDAKITFREQVLTMTKFRKGVLNCLFATSVAEEGLDVPECNLVIRFDLYKTVIQYVQSKGRARHKNSKFVDMIEQGNHQHQTARQDARFQEMKLSHWIKNLDPGRRIFGNEDVDQRIEEVGRCFTHPISRAKLTYWSALGVLSLFSATWPTEDKLANTEPAYIMSVDNGKYYCEVVMPEHAPIRSAFGLRYPRKALAKRSAAFGMCIKLLEGKFLDSLLLSSMKKTKPEGANAHLAVNGKKTGMYVMLVKPSLWADGRGLIPETVYLTIIDMPKGLDRSHQPIGLLTRHALPQLPSFLLFLNSGKISNVQTSPTPGFNVSADEIEAFNTYTLLLWNHVNAKVFENNAANMSYWVVPILGQWAAMTTGRDCIDWAAVKYAVLRKGQQWTPKMPKELLENKFMIDPWAGNRRFFSVRVEPDLKPLDAIPEETAKFNRPGANKKKNILQYSISLFGKKFDEEWPKWDKEQPVMECTQVMHRQNLLAPPTPEEKDVNIGFRKAFLCPEPLVISGLSTDIVAMFLIFPPIIHRIEDYLISLEAAQIVGIDIGPALALEAMTKDSDNSEDHTTDDCINFRPGMGNNYERLEFLGDCFLKTATSISLFVIKPHDDEFEFHVARMHMICNQNLMNHALDLGLTAYVRTKAFSRRLWYPDALKLLEGKGAGKVGGNDVHTHTLGGKSIADICEALIGAAFIQHNDKDHWQPHTWTNAIKAVSKFVNDPQHDMQEWDEYIRAYVPPSWQLADATAPQRDLVDKIENEQGYRFRWPRLLRSAFSHPSNPYTWERVPCYQRLEFLGDALLDLACVADLFYNYPDKDPQWLTEHKMAMVSNKFLGAVCVKIGFYRHMRHNETKLGGRIQEYVDDIKLAEASAQQTGDVDYWIHVKDPPKCLADLVEAYIGALFIDSGFNYAKVQCFFNAHIKPFFEDMTIYDSFANDHPTTRLHHTLSQIYSCQAYQLLCEQVDSSIIGGKPKVVAGLMIHKELVAMVVGESGRYARHRASKKANHELQGLTVKEFKAKFKCDCKAAKEGENGDVVLGDDGAA